MSIVDEDYNIMLDENGKVLVGDAYSMMASINECWFDEKKPAHRGLFDILCRDYAKDFDILLWYVMKERDMEWAKASLNSYNLIFHLMRQEFRFSLRYIENQIALAVGDEFDYEKATTSGQRFAAKQYLEYVKEKPSDSDDWKEEYSSIWCQLNYELVDGREECIEHAHSKPKANKEYGDLLNESLRTLGFLGWHMFARVETSCSKIIGLLCDSRLSDNEWRQLIRNSYIDFVEEKGRDIEHELKKLSAKYKTKLEPYTPEVWLNCYNDEFDRLKTQFSLWELEDEEELTDVSSEGCVKNILKAFNDGISRQATFGTYHSTIYKELMTLFDIVHRLNTLKCWMKPEMQEAYDMMLSQNEDTELPEDEQILLDNILKYVPCGNWKSPVTAEKVELFVRTVFGADGEHIDDEDVEKTEMVRRFFKDGKKGNSGRMEISWANIVGYFMTYGILGGGPKDNNKDFFGHDDMVNNINKGMKPEGASQGYRGIIELLDKYRKRILK